MDREAAMEGGSYACALEGETGMHLRPWGCFLGARWF